MLSRGAKAAARASTQFARCQPRRFDSHSTGHGESAGHEESALRIAGGSGSESMGVREDDSAHHTAYVNSVIERLLCGLGPHPFIHGRLHLHVVFRRSSPYPYHRRLSITRRRSRAQKYATPNSLRAGCCGQTSVLQRAGGHDRRRHQISRVSHHDLQPAGGKRLTLGSQEVKPIIAVERRCRPRWRRHE